MSRRRDRGAGSPAAGQVAVAPDGRSGPLPPEPRRAARVLTDPNVLPYVTGNLISQCGTWFQNIAQALLIWRLSHSVLLVGLGNFAQFAGVLLLAPITGAAADRFDRRRLIATCQLLATAVTGLLALIVGAGHGTVAVVVVMALLLGLTTSFSLPAQKAVVPTLVQPAELRHAVAIDSASANVARTVGPVAGALVVQHLGVTWAFGLNGVSYLALLAAVLVIRPVSAQARPTGPQRLGDGVRIVAADVRLAVPLVVVMTLGFSTDPVPTLATAYATRVFHRPDTLAGTLVGCFGAGAVLAAFVFSSSSRRPFGRIAAFLAAMVAGLATLALAPVLAVALAGLAVAGFGYLAAQTQATTVLQLGIDDDQRGRVMALWTVAFVGSRPVASLVDGLLATAIGLRATTLLMTVPAVLAAAAAVALGRRDRRPPGGLVSPQRKEL